MTIENFNILKGCLYGLKQKTIICNIKTNLSFPLDITNYNFYISNILNSDLKTQNIINNIEELLNLFALNTQLFYKVSKLSIYEKFKIISVEKESNNFLIKIALPYDVNPKSSLDSLFWLCESFKVFNSFKNEDKLENTKKEYRKYFEELITRHKIQGHNGVNHLRFLQAAYELNIRCDNLVGNSYIFGYGINSRYLESSFTDKTNVIGTNIAKLKNHTNTLLSKLGFPVPKHFIINSSEQACNIAEKLNKKVVIKPIDADGGFGVFAGLSTKSSIKKAFDEAKKISNNIALEEYIKGDDYRITVFNGKVIKIVQRVAGGVVGNGKNNIKQLVQIAQNSEELQRRSKNRGYELLTLDEEALDLLEENGLNLEYIPRKNEYIKLRRKSNISAGGTSKTVKIEDVHIDNLSLAIEVTKALRLDIAGVDLLIEDISKSWMNIGGGICEINAQPQIGQNSSPKIYHEILEELIPNKGLIPIILIIGKTIDLSVLKLDLNIGIANKNGVFLGNQKISNCKDFYISSFNILSNNQVRMAILQIDNEELIKNGLAFNRCDVIFVEDKIKYKNIIEKVESYSLKIIETKFDNIKKLLLDF